MTAAEAGTAASTPREGDVLPDQHYVVTRADLVRYAGASGDFNPIHWSDRIATAAGLPGVIAHGMLTMALAARALDTWAGAPGRVRELGCKFSRPVVVPDDDQGVTIVVGGTVTRVDAHGLHILLDVRCGDERVLAVPRAVLAHA